MQPDLRVLFERALDDEPLPPPGDPVREAMSRGRRIRLRRGLLAAGAATAAVVAGVTGVNLALTPAVPSPRLPAAEAMRGPVCTPPARQPAPVASIFLAPGITDTQRAALLAALLTDPAVRAARFEDRQAAYERFRRLWADSPDFVAAIDAGSLPESFRITLADPAAYPAFADRFRDRAGVTDLAGPDCPETRR